MDGGLTIQEVDRCVKEWGVWRRMMGVTYMIQGEIHYEAVRTGKCDLYSGS